MPTDRAAERGGPCAHRARMPLAVNHLGQLPAVTISFNLLNGYALSDAVTAMDQARDEVSIPPTM